MFQRIYDILVDFLGESKQGGYSKDTYQYQFNCPNCKDENNGIADNKYNLEVNFALGKFNCWKCGNTDGTRGNISYLIKKYGTTTLYQEYKEEINILKRARLYDIDAFSGITINDVIENEVKLPNTFQKINLDTCKNNVLKNYLKKRRITQDIIDRFNIGYTGWDNEKWDLRNRIIIPSYDQYGDLNYYVARDFTGKSKIKYKNCESDKKLIVFQDNKIDYDADICLVEGAIDCLYGPNTVSMLGKVLTKDSLLFQTLYKRANCKIYICLDSDTDIKETEKIYKLLNFGRLKNKIWYIRMTKYKDFGEVYEQEGIHGIAKILKSAKQFNELELI